MVAYVRVWITETALVFMRLMESLCFGIARIARFIVMMKMNKGFYALGRLKAGQLNKTELAYERVLKQLQIDGEIIWYKFEGLKFRLADNTFYTPDFAVMKKSGEIEIYEVKGFWKDDARVKIKVAADMYPFRFIAVKPKTKKIGGGWDVEVFD